MLKKAFLLLFLFYSCFTAFTQEDIVFIGLGYEVNAYSREKVSAGPGFLLGLNINNNFTLGGEAMDMPVHLK